MQRIIPSVARYSGPMIASRIAASTPLNQQPMIPNVPFQQNRIIEPPIPSSSSFPGVNNPIHLPTVDKPVKVYSFPTPDKVVMEAPTILNLIIEKIEPVQPITPINDPNRNVVIPVYAGPRMLTIRRKKMKKHKRRKRFDRDYFKYQKYHRQKKIKAEKLFRAKMNEMMQTLETFDPMEHVKSTIQRAKQEWSTNLTVSGKKKYPHWSELMALEELYGIEPNDYIEKSAGLPDEEIAHQIAQKRQEYLLKYSLKPKSDKTS
uniref:Mitochondrial mRNA-processing protein COX24 C-terminal domain-containing protein n=1 Tax=Panagrolaimus sp. JU765 TaxID=591449 RepID=A0AC34RFN0_9BILA